MLRRTLSAVTPATIALALLLALTVILPTRRLAIAGASRRTLAVYFISVWLVSVLAVVARGPARLLVPILLVAYFAPFITLGAGFERLRGRFGGRFDGWIRTAPSPRPAIKDVTPPEEPDPPT